MNTSSSQFIFSCNLAKVKPRSSSIPIEHVNNNKTRGLKLKVSKKVEFDSCAFEKLKGRTNCRSTRFFPPKLAPNQTTK
jgi:hypothetical protein